MRIRTRVPGRLLPTFAGAACALVAGSPSDRAQASEAPGASEGVARLVVIVALGALVAMLVAVRYAARLDVLAALRER